MAASGVIRLLDSAGGHPLQSWKVENREQVTIGRSEDNDIVVADPYVSRAHAYLRFDEARDDWRLISISRQQIVYQGESHGELALADGMVFRLGQHGCYLRFDQSQPQEDDSKTISFDLKLMPVLALDRQKMEREVNEIVEGDYFQNLKNAANQRRNERLAADTKVT
jgi:hypothetical protein